MPSWQIVAVALAVAAAVALAAVVALAAALALAVEEVPAVLAGASGVASHRWVGTTCCCC